jgi:hypothetical protein
MSYVCNVFNTLLSLALRNTTVMQSAGVKVRLPPFLLYESDILFGDGPTKHMQLLSGEFLGFNSGVIEDYGHLGCDAASLGNWFLLTQRFNVTSQKTGTLNP